MTSRQLVLIVLGAAALLLACGGDDAVDTGVDSSKEIRNLDEAERQQLCAWSVDMQGGEGVAYDCGDGLTVEVDTVDECVSGLEAFDSCALTVGQLAACTVAIADDPCRFDAPACAPLFSCF